MGGQDVFIAHKTTLASDSSPTISLDMEHSFILNICPHCGKEYIIIIVFQTEETIQWWPADFMQHRQTKYGHRCFCPMCGEPFNKEAVTGHGIR